MSAQRHPTSRQDTWRPLAALCVVASLGTSCAPPAPAAPPPAPPAPPALAVAPPPVVAAVDPSGEWELRWDRTFAGWQPAIFEGKLSLEHSGALWSGKLRFTQSGGQFTFESLRVEGDRLDAVFRTAGSDDGKPPQPLELSGWIREGRFVGEIRWGRVGWTPVGGRRLVLPHLAHLAVDRSFPAGDLAQAGADPAALRALTENAREERSSAIVVVKDGKVGLELYREGYDGGPVMAMSASKSIVSLAVGMLIAEGKLSLDTRMGALFPEWKKLGPKAGITVRQLLTHTSGLDPSRADWGKETIRKHALDAKLLAPPGTRFQYNNGAVDFLAVVFRQAAGVPIDTYLETHLFQKLDVVGAHWVKDSEGTPRGAGELMIRPVDLAKVGQLMLDGGQWHGQRLVPAEWVERSVDKGQALDESCGLLWWREGSFTPVLTAPVLAAWHDFGIDDATLRPARALVGQKFASQGEYREALSKAIGGAALKKIGAAAKEADHLPFSASVSAGPVRGFAARGWLGQYLVVLPGSRLVAVRMRASEPADQGALAAEKDAYRGFSEDVARLFPAATSP